MTLLRFEKARQFRGKRAKVTIRHANNHAYLTKEVTSAHPVTILSFLNSTFVLLIAFSIVFTMDSVKQWEYSLNQETIRTRATNLRYALEIFTVKSPSKRFRQECASEDLEPTGGKHKKEVSFPPS